jgi:hypothetical protein
MIYGIIISGILLIMLIFLMWLICYKEHEKIFDLFIGAMFMLFLIIFCFALSEVIRPQIKPMDVYQRKTILKYEVVNGVKVDSCVIWKD